MSDKIAFLIPSTSKNCNYKNINESSLINILYDSLKKFNISSYTFIVGFDDTDDFYINNIDNLNDLLPKNFHYYFLNNVDKSYVCIVNQLANIAIKYYNADFLYVIADDLIFYNLDYLEEFKNFIKNNNGIGLGHAIDKTNANFYRTDSFAKTGICTHPFVHVNHVKYLGYMFPDSIKNWFCDNWITVLYKKLNKVCVTKNPVIENKIYDKRYEPFLINNIQFSKLVLDATNILEKYISV